MIPHNSAYSLQSQSLYGAPGLTGANATQNQPRSAFDATAPSPAATLPSAPLSNQGLTEGLASILEMIKMLVEGLAGGGAAPKAAATQTALDKDSGSDPTIAQDTDIENTTGGGKQSARLDDTLAKIAQDPEGSKLLQAAKEKGYTIEVGDPSKAAGAMDKAGHGSNCPDCKAALDAGQQVNGVTLSGNGEKKIIINPNAPDFEKTVIHELVHAATDGDDNSQQEEGIADVIGYRVANRITGKEEPGSAQSIYQSKMANYRELGKSNDVRDTLAALGIDAGI